MRQFLSEAWRAFQFGAVAAVAFTVISIWHHVSGTDPSGWTTAFELLVAYAVAEAVTS